ncbi:MAG: OmpA family protein [Alphaproteobacteria bacterium]|nr:OmpA family protein [Alphaproteobacteria bacterium]
MGLTVAEAFMLVAFVLLMLLLFWRHQVQDEVERASQLSPEDWALIEQGAALVPAEQLAALKEQAERASQLSLEDWRQVEQGAVLVGEERLAELEERAGLIKDPTRRELAATAAALEPAELRKLTELARSPEAVAAAATLSEGAVPVSSKRLAALKEQAERVSQLSPEDWRLVEQGAALVREERLAALEERAGLVKDPARRELAETAATLEPGELRKLAELARNPEAIVAAAALTEGAVPVSNERLATLEERAGLVEDPAQRDLAKAAAALEPDELQKLTGLARDPDALSTDAIPVSPERLAALEGYEQWIKENEEEIVEAIDLRRALDPDGEDSNEELVSRIEDLLAKERAVDSRLAAVKDRLAEDAAARGEFIDSLKRELATDVEKAGGKIDPSGRVVFPETVVFETGSAVIPPSFKAVLDDICPRWLAELRNSADRFDIDEIRIEGHSSPEWKSAQTKRDAWVANLGLSQRRAQSVLAHCLDHAAGTPLGEWARGKLTAVGYSSSRPVTVDGREDPSASRRVVLGHEFNRDRLIADLGDAGRIETSRGAIRRLGGKAQVIDADTIKIGEAATQVRLDGIDAPELKQPCTAADESEWACGREAGLALERHIAGRNVVCDRLRPGLVRLRGVCRIEGEEVELNRWVVEAGWAFAFVKSSKTYAGDEAVARQARRGIWSGRPPVPPWEWRGTSKRERVKQQGHDRARR